ncbi:hypothetical protein ACFL28_01740 [Candidatus Omnitrophota bacterium]
MLVKILRFIGSIAAIPLCVAVTVGFYKGIISIRSISGSGLIFILGAFSYSVIHLLLFKLNFLYVLGHELMHAVATLFSGGKVMGIKISSEGGSVKTTTPNFLVTLAPYLIPGYTVFIAVLYFLLSFFVDLGRFSGYFIFFVGFTLMFHLVYTAESIRQKQSDLVRTGYLFSITLAYAVNLVIVFGIVSVLFKEASFFDFLSITYEKSKELYYSFWRQLFL